jgi:hypothetical protein
MAAVKVCVEFGRVGGWPMDARPADAHHAN